MWLNEHKMNYNTLHILCDLLRSYIQLQTTNYKGPIEVEGQWL